MHPQTPYGPNAKHLSMTTVIAAHSPAIPKKQAEHAPGPDLTFFS